jgi:hypothetical protein
MVKNGINKGLSDEERKARNERQKMLYYKNKAKILESRKKLYNEKHKGYKQTYYIDNLFKIKEKQIEYRTQNIDRIRERDRLNKRTANKLEENQLKNKNYYINNKSIFNEKTRIRNNIRYNTNPQFKAMSNYRSMLNNMLKGSGVKNSLNLTGLDIVDLKRHIESLFSEGMSWDNRKEWHIDHIKPVKLFDLTDPEQVKQCYHYTNLRPMWASDNKSKSAQIEASKMST